MVGTRGDHRPPAIENRIGMVSLKNHVAHVIDLNQLVASAMRVESAKTS
jgi:hypothetical protein